MTFWRSIENTEEEKKDEFDHNPHLIKETPRKKPENPICILLIGESQRFEHTTNVKSDILDVTMLLWQTTSNGS